MTISITAGAQVRKYGGYSAATTVGPATGTATQTMPITSDVVEITGPTATVTNRYTMADGAEGQLLTLTYLATGSGGGTTASGGDVHVVPSNIAPQSSITFRNPDDFWCGQFRGGKWRTQMRTTYELALSTASGAVAVTVDEFRLVRATGSDQAYTLPAGFGGQRLLLTALTGTTIRTVTPAIMRRYTGIRLGDDGAAGGSGIRYAMLEFTAGAWTLVSSLNLDHSATTVINANVIVT